MLYTNSRRVGVFIDVQNMYYSARNLFSQKVNFTNIVRETVGEADLIRSIAYTISTEGGQEQGFFKALESAGLEVKSKDLLNYGHGNKKGDWDVGITVDIIRMLDMLDVVVLVSGDGDFIPLVEYVKSRGRIVHVASFRESTSGSLAETADVYTNLSDSPETFLILDELPATEDIDRLKKPTKKRGVISEKSKKNTTEDEETKSSKKRRIIF